MHIKNNRCRHRDVHVIEHAKDIRPSTLLAFIAPDKPLEKAKEDLKNMKRV
jgi:hypothetical protein